MNASTKQRLIIYLKKAFLGASSAMNHAPFFQEERLKNDMILTRRAFLKSLYLKGL
jgi:hypothetical protein